MGCWILSLVWDVSRLLEYSDRLRIRTLGILVLGLRIRILGLVGLAYLLIYSVWLWILCIVSSTGSGWGTAIVGHVPHVINTMHSFFLSSCCCLITNALAKSIAWVGNPLMTIGVAYMHMHVQTWLRNHRARARTRVHTCTHTCMRTHAHMHTHVRAHARWEFPCMHAHMHTCTHACMRTCMRTHALARMHTCIRMHARTRVHTRDTRARGRARARSRPRAGVYIS